MAKEKKDRLQDLYNLLAGVDDTYNMLPVNMRMQIEKVSQGLSEFGPRKLHRRGPGTEFYESRDFRPAIDEVKKINARLSARAGRPIVVEKEAEIRQHFYLWRDGTGSMDFSSDENRLYTKKEASEIMLLAFAKHLAKNEEMIGILDRKGVYRGGKATEWLAHQLMDVTIVTGDMPTAGRKLPKNSTAVLFSDFLTDAEEIEKSLGQITGMGLKGFMIMVLDPQELEFNFKGHVEFEGMEGEGSEKFRKAEAMQAEYKQKMQEHVNMVQRICKARGFTFILQRTDEPLHDALLAIYGVTSKAPAHSPSPNF